MTDFATGSNSLFQHADVAFVSINVAGRDAHKLGSLPVVADAREALTALRGALEGFTTDEAYREEVSQVRGEWIDERASLRDPVEGEAMSQAQLILALNEIAQPGDTVIAAAGTPPATC